MNTNDQLVEGLVQKTGCDRTLAVMLLRFTGHDLDGAVRILEAVPQDVFAVKLKFITQVTGYVGAFFFCYDQKARSVKRLMGVISDERDIGKIDITDHWVDYESKLYEVATTRKVDGARIEQLKSRIRSEAFTSRLAGMLKLGKPVKRENLANFFVDELYNVFADTNIAVKFEIEMTDAFELNKSSRAEEMLDGENDSDEEEHEADRAGDQEQLRNESLIVLKLDPVLSPVSGTEVKDLEFGDELQVRISDEREIADYLSELIGAKADSIRVPVYTRLIDVRELEGGQIGVFTQFGPGILGSFKVPEDAKVLCRRDYDEEPVISPKQKELSPLVIMGGIVAVIVIFIMLIFISR